MGISELPREVQQFANVGDVGVMANETDELTRLVRSRAFAIDWFNPFGFSVNQIENFSG
jgi:hypothetical protein